jgi:hypothetical protein
MRLVIAKYIGQDSRDMPIGWHRKYVESALSFGGKGSLFLGWQILLRQFFSISF